MTSGKPAPTEKEYGIVSALTKALQNLGRLPLEGGALAQAWMPVNGPDGRAALLQTKGLPYSIIGPGDMLALFRCLSCKYSFSSNLNQLTMMGAPGRVFLSGEAETSDNVQRCNVSIYLRVKDAQACRVSSTVLLPVFADPSREQAVAVLEVTQFQNSKASYQRVFEWARQHLETAGLYPPKQLETRTFEMQSHALSIRFFSSRDSALGHTFCENSNAAVPEAGKADGSSAVNRNSAGREQAAVPKIVQTQGVRRASQAGSSSDDHASSAPDSDEAGDGVESPKAEQQQQQRESEVGAPSGATASGSNTGGASKASLTKEDLEKHFCYGLKEAAVRLGVCNTTLKRACRRHGIMKWPRRELLRNARLRKDAAAKTPPHLSSPARISSAPNPQKMSQQGIYHGHTHVAHPRQNEDRPLGQMPMLHHAGSSNYLSQIGGIQPQQPNEAALAGRQCGIAPSEVAPLSQGLHDLQREWQKTPLPMAPPSTAIDTIPPGTANLPLSLSDPPGSRRSSLGFDALFGEADGTELGAVLDDWEQHIGPFKTGAEPQAMEVVTQAVSKDYLEDVIPTCAAEKPSFPALPDHWPVKDGSEKDWQF